MPGQQTTQLEELTDHGFKAADITSVLDHDGGSKNIKALQGLLECMPVSRQHNLKN